MSGHGHGHMQIGEVADRTALSHRTLRYYEETGLVPPSARSTGGYRLYTERDVERLELVKRMKPLEFTVDEMRDLLDTLDRLAGAPPGSDDAAALQDRLDMYRALTAQRVDALRHQLRNAERFADDLGAQRFDPAARAPAGDHRSQDASTLAATGTDTRRGTCPSSGSRTSAAPRGR